MTTHTDHPATQRYLSARALVIALQAELTRKERELTDMQHRMENIAVMCRDAQDIDAYPSYILHRVLLHIWAMTGVQLDSNQSENEALES